MHKLIRCLLCGCIYGCRSYGHVHLCCICAHRNECERRNLVDRLESEPGGMCRDCEDKSLDELIESME